MYMNLLVCRSGRYFTPSRPDTYIAPRTEVTQTDIMMIINLFFFFLFFKFVSKNINERKHL